LGSLYSLLPSFDHSTGLSKVTAYLYQKRRFMIQEEICTYRNMKV
jgi:hypothetical protein